MSDSLQPHRLQNVRFSYPSSPKVCSKLMSTELVMPSNHLILCCPFSCPQSFPSSVFSNESALCTRWPKYWSFCISISSSNRQSKMFLLLENAFSFYKRALVQVHCKDLEERSLSTSKDWTVLCHGNRFLPCGPRMLRSIQCSSVRQAGS